MRTLAAGDVKLSVRALTAAPRAAGPRPTGWGPGRSARRPGPGRTGRRNRRACPPPPPPPPPEKVEQEVVSQVPIQVDVALQRDPVKLDVSPIEVTLDGPPSITDRIDVNLADFQRPSVEVDLGAIVFEKDEVDQIPSRSYSPMPSLPPRMRKEMGDARVIVQLSIDEKGRPMHVMVLNPPVPEARPHIVKDLKRWRFKPARKNGQKVKCWVRFVLVYEKTNTSPFSI